jgi:formamidopyrimidine-DNA glycosylase
MRLAMPELPDVESFCRHVASATVHQTIRHLTLNSPEMVKGMSSGALRTRLEGHVIEKTQRYGKHLLLKIEDQGWLDLHFGMSGHPQYLAADNALPPYTRMALELDHGRLAYVVPRKLGHIGMVDSPTTLIAERKLGPDALDPHLDFARFAQLARGKGTVKCWLMDQSQLAGIGNVYSDEILYHARLHPRRRVSDLSEREIHVLYDQVRAVLKTALAHDADPKRLPADWLLTHRHAGGPCPGCTGKIQRLALCGRSAYLCPSCQH